jgi:hypothetical protein
MCFWWPDESDDRGNIKEMKRICLIVAMGLSMLLASVVHADTKEDGFWNSVATGNVAEEYELYLDQYPKGRYTLEAKRRLEKLKGKVSVAELPEPVVRIGVDATAEDILWATVKQNHRAEEYQAYLKTYPQGRFVQVAKSQMQRLVREGEEAARKADDEAWGGAELRGSSDALQRYLDSYPQGQHRVKAGPLLERTRLKEAREAEDSAWKSAEAKGDLESYRKYADAYPKGAYQPLLQLRLDTLESKEWAVAENTKSRARLERFIKRYPQGQYIAQAQVKFATLPMPEQIANRYQDNDDGTVTDVKNKLQWMRCAVGQAWDGSTCQGTADKHKWEAARLVSSNFAGYSDWRLPNIEELRSLAYCSSGKPATWSEGKSCEGAYLRPTINSYAFSNTPIASFWSSSFDDHFPAHAWFVVFGNGDALTGYKGGTYHVRLVRNGQ